MVLILRSQTVVKGLLEISRFNLSKNFSGFLKMHFGELKMRFFPTSSIHIACYIRKRFECLVVSKFLLIWNMIHICVPLFCLKTITTQISINLLYCRRLHIGLLTDILTWSLFWGPKVWRKAYWKFPDLICQQILVVYKKCILASWKCVLFQPLQFTLYGTYETFLNF
jgi:hypothetical protein